MAKQSGIIPLKGTIGNITFYKSGDGYLAREKGGIDPKRIANDPAFQRTRENGAEFARAGKGSKMIRTALRVLIQNSSDRLMTSRLTRSMMEVVKADASNERGLRNIIDGEVEFLQGFEFNASGKLSATLFAEFTPDIDRVAGTLSVTIPSFVPANMIQAPSGTTHFKIVSGGAEIDFEKEEHVSMSDVSTALPWNSTATASLTLTNNVTANSTHPLFLALGIEFYQEVNGNLYPLKNGAFNALAIVKVSGE